MTIKLISVNLGETEIRIPVAVITGKRPGKTLLITAGADGDEYASIDAAYRVVKDHEKGKFAGKLIVIPLFNIPGFQELSSINPLDRKFPKFVFPGKEKGTATERLVYWLNRNYIIESDLWLDLHGGALTESLDPYAYFHRTGIIEIDSLNEKILKYFEAPKVVYRNQGTFNKADLLAQQGCAYVLAEAGYSSDRSSEWVNNHLRWVRTVMGVLKMLPLLKKPKVKTRIYGNLDHILANKTGLWFPEVAKNSKISRWQKVGEIRSFDNKVLQKLYSRTDGEYLWGKAGMYCKTGETLVQMACDRLH